MMNLCKSEMIYFKRDAKMRLTDAQGKYNNPLDWWRVNHYKYPILAQLARKLLAIPATSAPSEHIWSRVSTVLTAKRASTKHETAADIIYIRENLYALRKHYVQLAVEERGEAERKVIEMELEKLPSVAVWEEDIDVGK